jgi:hypothetical protein
MLADQLASGPMDHAEIAALLDLEIAATVFGQFRLPIDI